MTETQDPVQQVLGYVRHQAAKSLDDLAALMQRTSDDWQRCLEDMSDQQASFAPGTEWTAKEVVSHFLDVTATVNKQVSQVAAGGRLDFGPVADEVKPNETRSITELRSGLDSAFSDTVQIVNSLTDNDNLEGEFPHPMFGKLNIKEWVAFQRVHAMDHIQQIDKLKSSAGYPAA